MDTRRMKALKALAVLLAFAFAQVYVQAGLTSPATPGGAPQRFVARLTIRGGPSATVNGASAVSGATVLTGASIETPDGVSATIDLGAAGTVDVKPKSKILLNFHDDGNVRVKLTQGCAVTRKVRGDSYAEVYTAEGASEKTNSQRRQLGFCIQSNGKLSAKDPRLSTKLAP